MITGNPIQADVRVKWKDELGHSYSNYTIANISGFYRCNTAEGKICIYAEDNDYFKVNTEWFPIIDYETLWINVSMESRPPENSIICGYVTDSQTQEPINFAGVALRWQDELGHVWRNHTNTNTKGFYLIYSSAGEIYLNVEKYKYHWKETYRLDAIENETLWLNFSLLKRDTIEVDIVKPLRAVYCLNLRLIPFSRALIIGGIEIEAFVHDYWYRPLYPERVEFYIDGQLRSTDIEAPFSWMWRLGGVIEHKHTIKVIAYDNNGYSATDEIVVWKFF